MYLNQFYHIIDLTGQLLNKEEPDDDDETPSNEWMKYKNYDEYGIEFVDLQDVHKIIFAIFVG